MTVLLDDLRQMGFSASHKITLAEDGMPRFSPLLGASSDAAPAVYLWLAHAAEAETGEVLYVGKAGKGVARRCAQHQGGFTNSTTGRMNAAALAQILSESTLSVTVMARPADTITLFDETVSLYATEEDALCARFVPRLNRAAFPNVSKPGADVVDGEQSAQEDAFVAGSPESDVDRIGALINSRLRMQDEGTQDDMLGQIEAYQPQDLAKLLRMLEFVEAKLMEPEHALKLVSGYNNQISGCNSITTLGFGRLINRKFTPNGWVARIFLANTPRIAFPKRFLNVGAADKVEHAERSFAPLDVDAFFEQPSDFILAEHLR